MKKILEEHIVRLRCCLYKKVGDFVGDNYPKIMLIKQRLSGSKIRLANPLKTTLLWLKLIHRNY